MRFGIASVALLAVAALAVGTLVAPAAANAQDIPSYARPSYASDDETVHGRIRSIDGTFAITVRDDRGFVDNVALHQGTIINPTGLTLADGMSVTIIGHNTGTQFAANEIDTPYRYAGPVPGPAYYGPGWWYPGFAYGYGPAFSLAFVFGNGYVHRPFDPYYHGAYYHPPYYYRTAYARPVYQGVPPAFAGRTFAGPGAGYRETLRESRGYAPPSRSDPTPSRAYAPRAAGYAGGWHGARETTGAGHATYAARAGRSGGAHRR